jgi:hypothetical protein
MKDGRGDPEFRSLRNLWWKLLIGNELDLQLGRDWQGRIFEATGFYGQVVSSRRLTRKNHALKGFVINAG